MTQPIDVTLDLKRHQFKVKSKTACKGDHCLLHRTSIAEFNLEKETFKTVNTDGSVDMAMNFLPPRAMLKGKAGWNIFTACVERRGMLRLVAPNSIITY